MLFDCGNQKLGIIRALGEYFEVRDDLVLSFLHLHQLAELV